MKKLLLIILCFSSSQLWCQELEHGKEYSVNGKKFVTSKKHRTKYLTLDNLTNVNLKDGYDWYILQEAKYDRNKLSNVFLEVFTTDRIKELQQLTENSNPAIGMTWHIDRTGNVCSVTYRIRADTKISLNEFAQLEDRIKSEIKITDFLFDHMEQLEYYSLTFHIRLSRILDGSFLR